MRWSTQPRAVQLDATDSLRIICRGSRYDQSTQRTTPTRRSATAPVDARRPRRRRPAEARRLDHRSDLLRLDLHVRRHAERSSTSSSRSSRARNTAATATPARGSSSGSWPRWKGAKRRCCSPAAWRPSSGLLMAKLNAGDEVVFFDECYHRSREFCAKHLSRFGVVTRQVPACDYEAMEARHHARPRGCWSANRPPIRT